MAALERNFFGPDCSPDAIQYPKPEVRLWELEQFQQGHELDSLRLEQWTGKLEHQPRTVHREGDSDLERSPNAIPNLQGTVEGIAELECMGCDLAKEPDRRGTSGVGGRRRRLGWAHARLG